MKHTLSQGHFQALIVTLPFSDISLNISPLYHTRHQFSAHNTRPQICGTYLQTSANTRNNIYDSSTLSMVLFLLIRIKILTIKYSRSILELSHIMTKNLKSIPMHHVQNTLFHQDSVQIYTYRYL